MYIHIYTAIRYEYSQKISACLRLSLNRIRDGVKEGEKIDIYIKNIIIIMNFTLFLLLLLRNGPYGGEDVDADDDDDDD